MMKITIQPFWLATAACCLANCFVLTGCQIASNQLSAVRDPFLEPAPAAIAATITAKPAVPAPLPLVTTETSADAISDESITLAAYHSSKKPEPNALASGTLTVTVDPTAPEASAFGSTSKESEPILASVPLDRPTIVPTDTDSGELAPGVYPIDLSNALGIGGADSLQIRLARTRLFEAQARHLAAKSLWLPSLRLGIGYNKHDGRLQETEGNVLEINRNSLFYGGELGLGSAPLAGGASGPPRLFVNLSLADAIFQPRAACQEVAAHSAAARASQNDSLMEIAVAYHALVEANGQLASARHAESLANAMVDQVEKFKREGFSSLTESSRAQVNLAHWQRVVIDAERVTVVRSAKLARLLRLPPQVQLAPAEEFVLPIDYVDGISDGAMDVDAMVAMALGSRPEVAQYAAMREAAGWRVQEERMRPWIPSVQVGTSAGGFGGGPSSSFTNESGRSDVDLLAVWEWKNLGVGNVALQRERRGQLHQRALELEDIRDRIAAEVVAAAADVRAYRQQSDIARESIAVAQTSYELNDQRIRESEGLPIELIQSITALAETQAAYTEAVAKFNQAQYRLMHAMGNLATSQR